MASWHTWVFQYMWYSFLMSVPNWWEVDGHIACHHHYLLRWFPSEESHYYFHLQRCDRKCSETSRMLSYVRPGGSSIALWYHLVSEEKAFQRLWGRDCALLNFIRMQRTAAAQTRTSTITVTAAAKVSTVTPSATVIPATRTISVAGSSKLFTSLFLFEKLPFAVVLRARNIVQKLEEGLS